ncbi:MAG: glycosyltransferase [Promicromonosporaceae bacterium]|nr:glycosyltransferase [Promicromonosporaceae bacterium]
MRVFNFNKAIGLASSGVEYAQKYRRELLAGLAGVEDYYVFTDYLSTNIAHLTGRLGFRPDQVLWLYHLLSGRQTVPGSVTLDAFRAWVAQPHTLEEETPGRVLLRLTAPGTGAPEGGYYRVFLLDGAVDRVETVLSQPGEQLVTVAHYDESLSHVEHYLDGRPVRRSFYTPAGRLAAEQVLAGQEIVQTRLTPDSPLWTATSGRPQGHGRDGQRALAYRGDLVLDGRSALYQFVFDALLSRPDDVVIVDRAVDVIDALYPVIGSRRLLSVVHAEHYDLKQADDGVLLWNNHYEHVFTRPDLVDTVVVSTRQQQARLRAQLAEAGTDIEVAWVPVGYAEGHPSASYRPHALVTASRLASEKHLDLLVRAVALARERLPGLSLDIYGEGQRDPLTAVIDEVGAAGYVSLRGHQELDEVLGQYGLYVTASTSEGFGLSLLEALAQGLPIVGFDVEYGNRELVTPGRNGELVPYTGTDGDVSALAEAIVKVVSSPELPAVRAAALERAADFLPERVRARWAGLLLGGGEGGVRPGAGGAPC